ncbi:hypothetical protein FRC09_002314 [Ceratobasidium sp. 395]|nr:hypothetical protein FRC09_002314 [Ceratobasidium sp. 395]
MTSPPAQNTDEDEIDAILSSLPPPPPILAPRGIRLAAQLRVSCAGAASLCTKERSIWAVNATTFAASEVIWIESEKPAIPRGNERQMVPYQHKVAVAPGFTSLMYTDSDWFRFETKADLTRVRTLLGIPNDFITTERDRFTGDEALAVLLSRFAYPARLSTLADKWGRSEPAISRCVSELGCLIYTNWCCLLEFNPRFHTPERLERYAACIAAAGSPLPDIWGFIDCTINRICRPTKNQDIVYNGYKKDHAIKYQAVVTPDGLMCPVDGPAEGRRADGGILEMSELLETCVSHAAGVDGRQLFVYGDPAYGLSDTVVSGVKKLGDLTATEREFNMKMSRMRQSVEWGFGGVANNFAYMSFSNGLKLGLQPVGRFYLLAVIFTNIRAAMYPSEISVKFQCAPPPLEDYLISFK